MTTAKVDRAEFKNAEQKQTDEETGSNGRVLLKPCSPVTITTPEGETFEIADTPIEPAKMTAFAAEATLRKFWDNAQEDQAWRTIAEEI